MKLANISVALTEGDFDRLESDIGCDLPRAFKDFYLMWNGGIPTLNSVHDDKHIFPVHQFDELKEIYRFYSDQDSSVIPQDMNSKMIVPFASDQGGNTYNLRIKDSESARVIFFTHEDNHIHGEWDSFQSFLSCFVNESK